MRFHMLALWRLTAIATALGTANAQDTSLPDAQQLKQRALASMKASDTARERYSCLSHEETDELNADGSVKQAHSKDEEKFFVNGVQINHALTRDGTPLSGDAARKEQKRVDDAVRRYSDIAQAQKSQDHTEKQVDMFLRAVRFSNGHRENRGGRSTIEYHLSGDRNFQPKNLEERFAQALTGSIWVDEQTGNVAELRVESDHDVKIGGGLIANLHKGFRLHLVQERQTDGVWLTKVVDGSGDARAGLLFHPRVRFKTRLEKCHLFAVDSKQTPGEPSGSSLPKP